MTYKTNLFNAISSATSILVNGHDLEWRGGDVDETTGKATWTCRDDCDQMFTFEDVLGVQIDPHGKTVVKDTNGNDVELVFHKTIPLRVKDLQQPRAPFSCRLGQALRTCGVVRLDSYVARWYEWPYTSPPNWPSQVVGITFYSGGETQTYPFDADQIIEIDHRGDTVAKDMYGAATALNFAMTRPIQMQDLLKELGEGALKEVQVACHVAKVKREIACLTVLIQLAQHLIAQVPMRSRKLEDSMLHTALFAWMGHQYETWVSANSALMKDAGLALSGMRTDHSVNFEYRIWTKLTFTDRTKDDPTRCQEFVMRFHSSEAREIQDPQLDSLIEAAQHAVSVLKQLTPEKIGQMLPADDVIDALGVTAILKLENLLQTQL